MKAMLANKKGIVVTGTWMNEGHTVTFMILENDLIKISDYFHQVVIDGTVKRNWSTSRETTFIDAMQEQDDLIKWGYKRTT